MKLERGTIGLLEGALTQYPSAEALLYTEDSGALTVLDYKTDTIPRGLNESEAEDYIIDSHVEQLSYYYGAAKIITGKDVDRVVLYSFSLAKEIEIPKDKLDVIFDKFFRMDSSRSSQTGGSGLGLAIAKQIVELHGGTIKASSNTEYTDFTVILPYVSAETLTEKQLEF